MKCAPILAAMLIFAANCAAADDPSTIRFGRDILPILSHNCFQCHGPDEKARKAKLRLDRREGAGPVLAPGKPAQSELVRRISAAPGQGQMPPAKSNHKLNAEQKELLTRWIAEGAVWGKHWAYETPVRPALPAAKNTAWVRNDIDRFVLARLTREGLRPSPEASRETLIRRVTLDLTGLPPTLPEVDAFLADRSPSAYEKVVDRLLASPRYGETMAMEWLDEARFADTNGYQNDFARTMWPWRDWVIEAFHRNQPFDRFVVEQIAGDLLPTPTLSEKIATGFNRNNRTVTEAGSIDEEWRIENAVDRVETTATVFLGLTMGCGRCHDHKYDPISQKEFYQFLGFFNSVNEKGVYTEQRGNVPPLVTVPDPDSEQRLRNLAGLIAQAEREVREQEASLAIRQQKWEAEQRGKPASKEPLDWAWRCPLNGDLQVHGPVARTGTAVYRGQGQPTWSEGPAGKALKLDGQDNSFLDAGQALDLERTEPFSFGGWVRSGSKGALLSKMDEANAYRGFDLLLVNGKVEVHLIHQWPGKAVKVVTQETLPPNSWMHVFVTHDGSGKAGSVNLYVNGKAVKLKVEKDTLSGTILTSQPLRIGKRSTSSSLNGEAADIRIYERLLNAAEVRAIALGPIRSILEMGADRRSKSQQELLSQTFREHFATNLNEAKSRLAKLHAEKTEIEKRVPTVMVMEDAPTPRETFVLKRGRYDMPDKTQKVEPGIPGTLPAWPADAPRNRLGLARWLVATENPLTARVRVNRYWQQSLGIGLVKTADNFGIQGDLPSHPALLDYLATEFVRTGWDVKAMRRLIVTSAAYRQDSRTSPALLLRDPENRLLARGPRFRLPAETVRDNALAVSGLLVEKIGGPSVKPYQPAGLWEALAGGAGEGPYVQDKGPGLYRRSVYIYRKRTVPHPVLTTFDASAREVCQVKRPRTNTPLQALEVLNDVTYVEAARHLAQLMLTEGGRSPQDRLAYAFRRATARAPTSDEMQILMRGLQRHRENFRADKEAANRLIRHGDSPLDAKLDPVELAALTAMAGVILNLDETITKE